MAHEDGEAAAEPGGNPARGGAPEPGGTPESEPGGVPLSGGGWCCAVALGPQGLQGFAVAPGSDVVGRLLGEKAREVRLLAPGAARSLAPALVGVVG